VTPDPHGSPSQQNRRQQGQQESQPGSEQSAPAGGRELPAHFREKSRYTDTAGTAWAGRDYTESPFPDDDGSAPPALRAALDAVADGQDPFHEHLVAALAAGRVLVPIMAVATEEGATAHGLTGDNGADMAMVSITAPDGSAALPVFSSVAALSRWRTDARPVPTVTAQAAQAAVQENITSLLLDPVGPDDHPDDDAARPGPILLQRSILWALAQGRTWVPPHQDPELATELARVAAGVDEVLGLSAGPGTTTEVVLHVRLVPGLDRDGVQRVVSHLSQLLSVSRPVADRITSLTLSLAR
jgi:hypothetical protein